MYLVLKGKIPAQGSHKLPQISVIAIKKEFDEASALLQNEIISNTASYGYEKEMVKDRVQALLDRDDGQHTLVVDENSIAEIKTLNHKAIYIYNFISRTAYQLQKTK